MNFNFELFSNIKINQNEFLIEKYTIICLKINQFVCMITSYKE